MIRQHVDLIVPDELIVIAVGEHAGHLIAQCQTVGNIAQAVDDDRDHNKEQDRQSNGAQQLPAIVPKAHGTVLHDGPQQP